MEFQSSVVTASFNKPVVVMFTAPWCPPCRFLKPQLKTMSENDDRWGLVFVNVDEERELAIAHNVRGIPRLVLYAEGRLVSTYAGSPYSKHHLGRWIDAQFPKKKVLQDQGRSQE